VRLWRLAGPSFALIDVRFLGPYWAKSGHGSGVLQRPLLTQNGRLGPRLPQFEEVILTPEVRKMADRAISHYSEDLKLADAIAEKLRSAGKDLSRLTATDDLAVVDEFHIRSRKAVLELGEKMNLHAHAHVLDIGSGLGGPAQTLAETYGCRVTGADLTQAFFGV
jgi:hypothetical protein